MSLAVLPRSIVLDWAHLMMEKILHPRAMVALSMIALRSNAGAGRARSDRRHQTAMMAVGSKGPKEFSVPRLGTGTWAWGNKVVWGYEESMDAELGRAYEAARRLTACDQASNGAGALFDTGDSYGTGRLSGRSEVLLGEFGERHRSEDDDGEGEEALLATKLATYPWRVTRGSMVSACEASLRRLKVDKVGLAQIHWPASKYNPLQEQALWRGLGDIYDGGLARAVGVSNYGPKQLKKIHAYLAGRCANPPRTPAGSLFDTLSLSLSVSTEGGSLWRPARCSSRSCRTAPCKRSSSRCAPTWASP